MFGDILFATIPFATFDGGESPVPYSLTWIDRCPNEDGWDNRPDNSQAWVPQPVETQQWNNETTETNTWDNEDTIISEWQNQDPNELDTYTCKEAKK